MKKIVVVVTAAALVISLVSLAFAAAAQQGTIKSVDAKAGTIVFCTEGGPEVTLKADKSVDLDKIKAGDKVEISAEDGTLKSVKAGHVSWCPEGY
jgi:Cu/Ag efflux protein CusF